MALEPRLEFLDSFLSSSSFIESHCINISVVRVLRCQSHCLPQKFFGSFNSMLANHRKAKGMVCDRILWIVLNHSVQ